ncbi:hypothetical protein FZC79_04935 [Rossellomorea vietnamensis]|uniref:Arrestin-like N-terminal domain-containing protein n=2 Tax=Rossellomorea TaxID=2837508 RepID=A0A5D4KK05_9BACI|nr:MULTISPECIES: hypothetical protein [Rossellomorea]TYR77045.1 hypothetical protein FZC79_04935 [Rossellomorea vietnamensis]TYS84264.1 hypothetical protein FZC80_01920 [Rossellomorea aquimaris]
MIGENIFRMKTKHAQLSLAIENKSWNLGERVSGVMTIGTHLKKEKVKGYEVELIGKDQSNTSVFNDRHVLCSKECTRQERTEIPFNMTIPHDLPAHMSYYVRVGIIFENAPTAIKEEPILIGFNVRGD